jgi:hypothetical protein
MVLTVEPCPVPSPKGSLHRKVKETSVRAGLETHTPDNLAVCGTWLVCQEKVILEQWKVRRNSKQSFTKVNKDNDLKNGIRVEMD